MIHRKETAEILARLGELEAAGRSAGLDQSSAASARRGAALATVVRIVGSAYRRPGAKFLIEADGGTLGSVSGGCLEADVREVGLAVLAGGEPRLLHYDTGADDDPLLGLGLGCNGRVEIFVQAATHGPFASTGFNTIAPRLRELLAGEDAVAVVTAVDGARAGNTAGATLLVSGAEAETAGSLGTAELDRRAAERARGLAEGGRSTLDLVEGRALFFDLLPPPCHLFVCGAGDDARPLVAYAADAGYRVTVLDHRPALPTAERFPQAHRLVATRPEDEDALVPFTPELAARSQAVVMTHSLRHDREWARRLLAAGLPYVGLLGPRERTAALLAELGANRDPRAHGPVGLDLGADGPRQVALSIVAELLALRSGRRPRHLSEREEAIHAD